MADIRFDFSDSVVVVTGAARGVGREIVSRFLAADASVIAVDRDRNGLREATAALSGALSTVVTDIRDAEAVHDLFAAIRSDHRRVDVCVNNAAVAPHRSLSEYPESLWESVFAVNCTGTFLMTRAASQLMIGANVAGRIINFSSAAATRGGHGSAAYASSRAATEAFGRVAAMELARYGILVNTVRPGLIDTQPRPLPARMKSALIKRIPTLPLRRPGRVEEVAEVVLFLASPAASYMTGSVVTVDGGASIGSYSADRVVDDDPRYLWLSGGEER